MLALEFDRVRSMGTTLYSPVAPVVEARAIRLARHDPGIEGRDVGARMQGRHPG